MSLVITLEGARDLESRFALMPQQAATAARIAINDAAKMALGLARKQIYAEVAFPRGYLNREDRLRVSRPATNQQLEAVVSGRDRPTSLARFVPDGTRVGRKGSTSITVTVKPGQPRVLQGHTRLFNFSGNRLLVLRLKPGQRPSAAYHPRPIFGPNSGMWILYGPSVDQVFRGVADDISPAVTDHARAEFDRVFTALQV